MKANSILILAASLALLPAPSTQAEDNTGNANLYRLNFRGTCRSLSSSGDRVVTTRITDKDLITTAFDLDVRDRASLRDYSVVYNADADSIQAVNQRTGQAVDLFQFSGGAATSDGRILERFAFLFVPGGETSIGSVTITERAGRNGANANTDRASIVGRFQFATSAGTAAGAAGMARPGQGGLFRMNSTSFDTDPAVEICTGTFSTNRRLMIGSSVEGSGTDTSGGATGTGSGAVAAVGGTAGGGGTVVVAPPPSPGTVVVTPVTSGTTAGAGGVFAPVSPVNPGVNTGSGGVFIPVTPTSPGGVTSGATGFTGATGSGFGGGSGFNTDLNFGTGAGFGTGSSFGVSSGSGSSFGTAGGSGSSFTTSFGSGTGTGVAIGSGSLGTVNNPNP
jgi:hypothetical protein